MKVANLLTFIMALPFALASVTAFSQKNESPEGGAPTNISSFEPFLGSWRTSGVPYILELNLRWAEEGHSVFWTERAAFSGKEEEIRPLVTGLVVFHPIKKTPTGHVSMIGRQLHMENTWSLDADEILTRHFRATYGDGWSENSPSGTVREFREQWVWKDENTFTWTNFVWKDGEWKQNNPPVDMVRILDQEEKRK